MSVQNLQKIIASSKSIVIVQGDNPDGDSLASSLALEQILYDLGKQTHMYCSVDIPKHLRHLHGWDRVEKKLPKNFDMSIVIDCSSQSLLEIAEHNGQLAWLLAKPLVIIDHHDITQTLQSTITINNPQAVSTGEVIYDIARQLDWTLHKTAMDMIASSILSDSLGLMTESTTPHSIRIIADLVEAGVNLPELEETRRETMRKSIELTRYKGELLQRIEFFDNNQIATITIPWKEIEKYSSQYNPSMLVLDDMRLIEDVKIAIAFKTYPNNRITAKIRSNYGYPIARALAEHFGAGGHPYASGFKVNNSDYDEIKTECINVTSELLRNLNNEHRT